MSDYTPEDIVKYSLSGDGARAKEAIQGVLANKVTNIVVDNVVEKV